MSDVLVPNAFTVSPMSDFTRRQSEASSSQAHPIVQAGPSASTSLPYKVERPASPLAEYIKMEKLPSDPAPPYLQPDSFYPLNNGAHPTAAGRRKLDDYYKSDNEQRWLSPEDDPMATRGIPVFRPTMEEFQDFEAYVTKTVPWGQRSGITKIIPPDGWKRELPPIKKEDLARLKIENPIQQNIFGSSGLFKQTNIVKNKKNPLSIHQWFDKCQERLFAMPNPIEADRTVNRDSKEAIAKRAEIEAEFKQKREALRLKRRAAAARKVSRQGEIAKVETAGNEPSTPFRAQSEHSNPETKGEPFKLEHAPKVGNEVPVLEPSSQTSSQSSPEPSPQTPEAAPVDEFYDEFNLAEDWLPKGARPEDYTPDNCHRLERMFWKNMGMGEPSWYGADLQGSLFADKGTPWNVSNLPNLLNRSKLKARLPGVNSPYLYFGMWRAAFSWHVEDMDLFSINYIHFGAPKFWYAVPQGQAEQFERTLSGYFEQESRVCNQFLRHKSFNVSPQRLARDGIRVNSLVHNQNEFVITYPRGYHSGFNLGFNCAESINFALDSWVELGRRAKACQCIPDSVRIDVDELLAEEELVEVIQQERRAKRSRKSTNADDVDTPSRQRKRRPALETTGTDEPAGSSDDEEADVVKFEDGQTPKRRRKPIQVIPLSTGLQPTIIRETVSRPCLFCPSLQRDCLLSIYSPAAYLSGYSQAKQEPLLGHRSCASAIPETTLKNEEWQGRMQDVISDADSIPKDRWKLKCSSCKDKKLAVSGAKIQCTKGKCPKAYHVSCAQADEYVQFSTWETQKWEPLPTPANTPIWTHPEFELRKISRYELLCPTHNPAVKEIKRQQAIQEHKAKIMALLPGSMMKIKAGGGLYEAKLVEAIEESSQVKAMTSDGVTRIFDWSLIDLKPKQARPAVENEYAREYLHKRSTDGLVRTSTITSSFEAIHRPATAAATAAATAVPVSSGLPSSTAVPRSQQGASVSQPTTHHRIYPPPSGSQVMSIALQRSSGPMSVTQMLNPSPSGSQNSIPTRVVVCQQPNVLSQTSSQQPHRQPSSSLPHSFSVGQSQESHRQSLLAYQQQTSRQAYQHAPTRGHPDTSGGQAASASYHLTAKKFTPSSAAQPHPAILPPYISTAASAGFNRDSVASCSSGSNGQLSAATVHGNSAGHTGGTRPSVPTSGGQNGGIGKIDLGLDRMKRLMACLPSLRVPAIHLAGTNGKGSVSAILESCLRQAGMRTGRYNSPHLLEPRDAICICGQPPSRAEYGAAMQTVQQANNINGIEATTFEIATAAAFYLINTSSPPVDVMIIECGMGGAKDATNVIPPHLVLASGLTSVGLDHTAFLGETIREIASEKAKIVVDGGLLIVAPHQHPDAVAAAGEVARSKSGRLIQSCPAFMESTDLGTPISLAALVKPDATRVRVTFSTGIPASISARLSLPGPHQRNNLSLALTILHTLRSDHRALRLQPKLAHISDSHLQQGPGIVHWPGRCSWEVWNDFGNNRRRLVLVDGAHNSDSARELRSYTDRTTSNLADVERHKPITFIISLSDSKGKTIESVLSPLLRPGDRVGILEFTTPVEGMPWVQPVSRTTAAAAVRKIVGEDSDIFVAETAGLQGMVNALHWASGGDNEQGMIVVCGSLYLVADFYRILESQKS